MTIGEALRRLRETRRLTLRKAATNASISFSSLSRLENNVIDPTPDDLRRLAEVYQAPYHELLSMAGYLDDGPVPALHRGLLAEVVVSEEEAEELLGYLEYLRWRKVKEER